MKNLRKVRPSKGGVPASDPRWLAVSRRDAGADGKFVYSVKTTGIYCRPSCAARLPRLQNVAFHDSCETAARAGFRPCMRCRPQEASAQSQLSAKIVAACRRIEQSEQPVRLRELADKAQLSSFHFHRSFKRFTGLTPKQYAAAHRSGRLRRELRSAGSVTQAIFDAGYPSSSRFYEQADAVLGMKPGDYRVGGRNSQIRFAIGECTLGAILVAQSSRGICAISIGDDPHVLIHELEDRFAKAELVGGDRQFENLVARVVGMIEAPGIGVSLPLDIRGTAFQQRVWRALRRIAPGRTLSYAEIARRIGAPRSVRAVAQACGANLIAVAIPCHRVVRSDGALSGYRWGVQRKQALLEREASA